MTLATVPWSDELPSCPQNWQEEYVDNAVRSGSDASIKKVRKRYTRDLLHVQMSLTLVKDKYQVWDDFYKTDLQSGVVAFEYKHPYTGKIHNFRLTDTPKLKMVAKAFTINLDMEEVVA